VAERLIDPDLAAAATHHATQAGGEGMNGNRTPGMPRSTQDIGDRGTS